MTAMADAFRKAQSDLNDSMGKLDQAANQMEGGALLGDGGTAMVAAIREVLVSDKMTKILNKLTELEGDVQKALKDHQDAEKAAKDLFK
jgi:hypothetical protein